MSRFPTIVSPRIESSRALEISRSSDAHFLLVVDGDQLLGVARACDLRRAPAGRLLERCVRVPVITVGELEPVHLARHMLTQTAGGLLVVVDRKGHLKGVLTFEDLLRSKSVSPRDARLRCEACGGNRHLVFGQPDEALLCCGCLEQARTAAPATLTGS
jgi:CBS domain-containing protein